MVVDYQKDFVDGTLGFLDAPKLEMPIGEKVAQYLQNEDLVIFTLDTHDEDYLQTREGKHLPVCHCQKGTAGWKLYGSLAQYHQDSRVQIVEKPSFGSMDLPKIIAKKCDKVDHIEICGLVTNLCVISNAILLQNSFREAEIVIDASCCDSYDKALHQSSIDVMRGMQMTVIESSL